MFLVVLPGLLIAASVLFAEPKDPLEPGQDIRVVVPEGPPGEASASTMWQLDEPGVFSVVADSADFDVTIEVLALSEDVTSREIAPISQLQGRFVFETTAPGRIEVVVFAADLTDWGGRVKMTVVPGIADLPGWRSSPFKVLDHWANRVEEHSRDNQPLKHARALIHQARAGVDVILACQQEESRHCDGAFMYLGYGGHRREDAQGPLQSNYPSRSFIMRGGEDANPRGSVLQSYRWACNLLTIHLREDHPYVSKCRDELEALRSAARGH